MSKIIFNKPGSYFVYGQAHENIRSIDIVLAYDTSAYSVETKFSWSYDNEHWTDDVELSDLLQHVQSLQNISIYVRAAMTIDYLLSERSLNTVQLLCWRVDNEDFGVTYVSNRETTTIIKQRTTPEIWNPYRNLDYAKHIRQQLSQAVSETLGHIVIYFRTEPDKSTVNYTFKTYGLHSVVDQKSLKIVFDHSNTPSTRPIINEWLAEYEEGFEIHIDKTEFAKYFEGQPHVRDFLYFPMFERMYTVNTVYENRDFANTTPFYTAILVKYVDSSNIRTTPDQDDMIDSFTDYLATYDDLHEIKDATGATDTGTSTDLSDDTLIYNPQSNLIFIDKSVTTIANEIVIRTMQASRYQYNLTKAGLSLAYRYTNVSNRHTFMCIFDARVSGDILTWRTNEQQTLATLSLDASRFLKLNVNGQGQTIIRSAMPSSFVGLIVNFNQSTASISIVNLSNLQTIAENVLTGITWNSLITKLEIASTNLKLGAIKVSKEPLTKSIALQKLIDPNPANIDFSIVDNCDAIFAGLKLPG